MPVLSLSLPLLRWERVFSFFFLNMRVSRVFCMCVRVCVQMYHNLLCVCCASSLHHFLLLPSFCGNALRVSARISRIVSP